MRVMSAEISLKELVLVLSVISLLIPHTK